jgi:hypothetical protein
MSDSRPENFLDHFLSSATARLRRLSLSSSCAQARRRSDSPLISMLQSWWMLRSSSLP